MELLGVGDYFKAKLEAVGEDWREAFSSPQRSSNQSRSVSSISASSPARRSCKSYAPLNSPVLSSRHFLTLSKLDDSFNLKKNLIEAQLDDLTLDVAPKSRIYETSRDTNNNLEGSQKKAGTSPNETNWGWWNRTTQLVNNWLTDNEPRAVKDSQNSQKRKLHKPQQRKRSRIGSNRYRASFRPKKSKTQ